jgi:hypothetical protein
MAGSVVQQSTPQSFNNVSGVQTFSMPANFTAGNSAVVEIACYHASSNRVSSVTVNGVSASLLYRETAAGVACVEVWLARGLTGGSASVSITPAAGSGYYINACCAETTALTSAADKTVTASSSGTSFTLSTGTATASADELVVAVWRDDTGTVNSTSPSAQSPLTQGFYQSDGVSNLGGASGHKVVTSTGIQTAVFNNSPTTLHFGVIVTIPFATSPTLTGSAATSASGTLAKLLALALVGSAATASVGTLSAGGAGSVALTGSAATVSAGTVTAGAAKSASLTGSAATTSAGSVGVAKSLSIAGNAASALPGAFGSGGGLLGANTFLGMLDSDSTNPAVTSAINTQATGSSFLTFQGGYTNNNSAPTDTYSNTWPLLDTQVYLGYSGQFNFKIYTAQNGGGGTSHTVTINKNGTPVGEIVTGLYEVKGASKLSSWSVAYPTTGTSVTSNSVTVTRPATMIAIWTGDRSNPVGNSASPGNGFTVLADYTTWPGGQTSVQTVVASKEVMVGGSYTVNWTVAPSQGSILYLFAFETRGDPLSIAVSLNGSAATTASGSLTPSVSGAASLTGAAASSSAGSVVPAIARAISGTAETTAAGSVSPSQAGAATLTGSVASTAQGSLQTAIAAPLAGSASTTASGAVAPALSTAIAGSAATGASGTLGRSVALPLSGSATSCLAGSVVIGAGAAIGSQLATATAGNLGKALALPLVGSSASTSIGTVTPASGRSAALSGSSASTASGAVAAALLKPLAGAQAVAIAGSVIVGVPRPVLTAITIINVGMQATAVLSNIGIKATATLADLD